jgi:hypothetical protein
VDAGGVERRASQLTACTLLSADYAARIANPRGANHAADDYQSPSRPDAKAERSERGLV